jgi:hypothetical protein
MTTGTFGMPEGELRPFPAARASGDAEAMDARFHQASQAPSAAPLYGGGSAAGPSPLDQACCCVARAVVRVVMPPTAGRPHETELLLCGHHYRVSRAALAAAHARVEELTGSAVDPTAWFHDERARARSMAVTPTKG